MDFVIFDLPIKEGRYIRKTLGFTKKKIQYDRIRTKLQEFV